MLTQLDLRNIIRIEENRKEVNKMNARIEAVRKHEGLTQEQFADRINLSRNYLWMLENGSRTDRKSKRLNSSHPTTSRMPSSA